MARLSELNDDEASKALLRAYREACDSYDPEAGHGNHPSHDVVRWTRIAATGGANSEQEIEKPASDDQQPEKTAGGNSGAGGEVPAQDGRYLVDTNGRPRFETSDGRVLTGDAALVERASQSSPSRAKRMAAALKNYDRLK